MQPDTTHGVCQVTTMSLANVQYCVVLVHNLVYMDVILVVLVIRQDRTLALDIFTP